MKVKIPDVRFTHYRPRLGDPEGPLFTKHELNLAGIKPRSSRRNDAGDRRFRRWLLPRRRVVLLGPRQLQQRDRPQHRAGACRPRSGRDNSRHGHRLCRAVVEEAGEDRWPVGLTRSARKTTMDPIAELQHIIRQARHDAWGLWGGALGVANSAPLTKKDTPEWRRLAISALGQLCSTSVNFALLDNAETKYMHNLLRMVAGTSQADYVVEEFRSGSRLIGDKTRVENRVIRQECRSLPS
jgi:hypothetical protein